MFQYRSILVNRFKIIAISAYVPAFKKTVLFENKRIWKEEVRAKNPFWLHFFMRLLICTANWLAGFEVNIYRIFIYIYYIWSVAFIVTILQLRHINVYVVIFFLFNFSIIVFNIYFLNIYTSLTFLSPLSFHLPTTFLTFLLPLPFHLSTILYINIILPISLHLPLFFSFLFTPSYYKFVIIFSILCIVFPHRKCSLSLSLSLSLSIFLWIFF